MGIILTWVGLEGEDSRVIVITVSPLVFPFPLSFLLIILCYHRRPKIINSKQTYEHINKSKQYLQK